MSAVSRLAARVGCARSDGTVDWQQVWTDDLSRSSGEQAAVEWLRLLRRAVPMITALDRDLARLVVDALHETLLPEMARTRTGAPDPAHAAE